MPEYLAPGVYIEETSYRAKSIEGVSTTTTGFIGPTRYGPVTAEPDVITSLGEFERTYGGGQQLRFRDGTLADNYMWHAARAFFAEGGRRLYVSRVFRRLDDDSADASVAVYTMPDTDDRDFNDEGLWLDGHARWPTLIKGDVPIRLTASSPGAAGNITIRLELKAGVNLLGAINGPSGEEPVLGALQPGDVVWIRDNNSPLISPLDAVGDLYLAVPAGGVERDPRKLAYWTFRFASGAAINAPLTSSPPPFGSFPLPAPQDPSEPFDPTGGLTVRVLTLTATLFNAYGDPVGVWSGLPLDPDHRTNGQRDAFSHVFGTEAPLPDAPFIVELGTGSAPNGLDIVQALFGGVAAQLMVGTVLNAGVAMDIQLTGGSDGAVPTASEYQGAAHEEQSFRTGLKQFEAIDDISIIAAPGSTWNYTGDHQKEANTIINHLLTHADRMKYRIAVIDSAEGQTIAAVRKMRAKLDSKYGAFYYPWVRILDPITRDEIGLPPSGFVAGIYARNDIERAVFKAPANEVVRSAIGFERLLNKAEQEVLNPEGVNCFRFFPGRGYRLWGARLLSSDPEWKYVNLRRYFAYLEHSIDKGTQWAVFEPNGELTWANVRRTIEDFLLNEWLNGALLGEKPERAYFVKCDRSTMSQNDLDNGRLVCLIGVAPLRPAEFVIFRIGQWTGDRKV